MEQKHIDAFKQFFNRHIKDENAIQFLMDVIESMRVWDDLYDDDPVEKPRINAAFMNFLHNIPLNPFYQAYSPQLHAMLMMMYLKWDISNKYEKEKRGTEKAYILRAELYGLIHYVILLTQGLSVAEKLGVVVWDLYGETVGELASEVAHA